MSHRSGVREHFAEHTEVGNSSGNGFHIAAGTKTCPAASVFSAVTVDFQL